MDLDFTGVNALPLVDIPMVSFFKSLDNNSSRLSELRGAVSRTKGFMMIRQTSSSIDYDTFPLAGGGKGISGRWFLGRIIDTRGMSPHPYEIEIYCRSMKPSIEPTAYVVSLDSEEMLEIMLTQMIRFGIDDPKEVFLQARCQTFADRGFDVC